MAGSRERNDQVPALRRLSSLLLVHGAGSGPWVFEGWGDSFPGLDLDAVDLQAGLVVERASMSNYAAAVAARAALLPPPVALCGWSMGGLAVMMAAARVEPEFLVLLEPSPPREVQGFQPGARVEEGTFDPQQVYGAFPPDVRARPESALARGERQRGISVPSLAGLSTLVVYGDEFGGPRGRALARFYGTEECYLPGVDHWGLVREPEVRRAVATRLGVGKRMPSPRVS